MRFFPVLALASVAFADVKSIQAALSTIQKDVVTLNSTVTKYKGGLDLLGALDVQGKSLDVLHALEDGTKTAQKSTALSQDDTFDVANSVVALSNVVNSTLDNLIVAKKRIGILGPVILINLKAQKSNTDKFGAAVVAKTPEDLHTVGTQLIGEIDAYFDKAIAAYS